LRLGPRVPPEIANEELVDASLEVARQELLRATAYFGADLPLLQFDQQALRLSPERLARIQAHLQALHAEVVSALADPARGTYKQQVALTYLLHSMPSTPVEVPGSPIGGA
jgi:hypothetical protein